MNGMQRMMLDRVCSVLVPWPRLVRLAMTLAMIGIAAGPGLAQRADQFTLDARAKLSEIISGIQNNGDLSDAQMRVESLGDSVAAHAGARQFGALSEIEGAAGVIDLVVACARQDPALAAADTLTLFARHPAFTTELGLLVDKKDDEMSVLRVALRLMSDRGTPVDRYPALAAAVCVVHDLPKGQTYSARINENTARGPGALAVFDFFAGNAGNMFISPDRLPAVLLVYVVDVSESVEELRWANARYRTSPAIGQRFFEIVYDYEHFRQGKTKRVTAEGNYCIEQIKKYGGVCADQAYFAQSVAKACGIPSAYVRAQGADVSHAWVGFMETRGRSASWNFDEGRYPDYQKLRGDIVDPQTRERISDGRVGVLGTAAAASNDDVLAALAVTRVVERMNRGRWSAAASSDLDARGNTRTPRSDSVQDRLALLRRALSKCAGIPKAWDAVSSIAAQGEMSEKELDEWSRAVMRITGPKQQDFSCQFIGQLIATVDDPAHQHEMWEWAFAQFRARPDLAARIRFAQGELWERQGNPEYAWIAYQDVLNQFLNDGPMSVETISAMGELLAKNDKRDAYLPLLQDMARKVNRPDDMATNFATQSNYYKINRLLVKELEHQHRQAEARVIRDQIHMPASD